jgi:hypothetical protein
VPANSSSPASAAHSVSVSVSIVGTAPSRRKSPVDKGEQALGFVRRFAPDVGQERHSAQFLQLLANELEDGLLVEFHSGFRKLARDAGDKRSGAFRALVVQLRRNCQLPRSGRGIRRLDFRVDCEMTGTMI